MIDLSKERFYGAKSEPIDSVEVASSRPMGDFEWQLLDVSHGGTVERYQVLVSDERDALATEAGASAYLSAVSHLGEVHGEVGGVSARPMGAEQSNTSLIVDDAWVLKAFRRVERGINPDVELLSRIADCPHVAGVRGYVTLDGATLAMQQQLIVGGEDGFDLATGGNLGDAIELGAAIRVVHDALAQAFGTWEASGSDLRAGLESHLDELVAAAPQLRSFEGRIRELYSAIPAGPHAIQRIHGDLHLGQTLKTVSAKEPRFYLIDFEGEPARPLEQRRAPDHPLRDVAGMIRSLGYARAVGRLGDDWERSSVDALVRGYGSALPADDPVLAAYVVDKAAYEVVYEANNRPDWVDIPLAAIEGLV
ncbi:phosphotransferase [Corynebacterium liangguodongii]|uniref:Trehalose synthase n=1 Tax=Corynebacterium liangguodongii TaxID=2079535 RepID=A0A2S0WFE2_9CORY|nr:phosphotransferase [Corynebacterium liangguodongii]AWB84479.1 trehalose synthase [Corynebacterium liangguodongii]PWB98697.1 trehalose synthase [Corynebacterium liangguodongii]